MISNAPAPRQYVAFLVVLGVAFGLMAQRLGGLGGFLAAFDLAASVYMTSVVVKFRSRSAALLRDHAQRYDPSRSALLALSVLVLAAVVAALVAELARSRRDSDLEILLALATLVIAWLFANLVFSLHYAYVFYDGEGASPGLAFPGTPEPDFWDFCYFGFGLGMTFQVSDVQIASHRIRRLATAHALLAFLFNIGVLALTVNVVAGLR